MKNYKAEIEKYFNKAEGLAKTEIKKHTSCGCTIEIPHSHLVMGFTCECEKGVPKSYQMEKEY